MNSLSQDVQSFLISLGTSHRNPTTMAPPHTASPRSQRYDRDREIWTLSNKAHFTYDKIHEVTGVSTSTIGKVVRRAKAQGGDLHDAPRSERPPKVTTPLKQQIDLLPKCIPVPLFKILQILQIVGLEKIQ